MFAPCTSCASRLSLAAAGIRRRYLGGRGGGKAIGWFRWVLAKVYVPFFYRVRNGM